MEERVLKGKWPGAGQEDCLEEEVPELNLGEYVDLAQAGDTQNAHRPGGMVSKDFLRTTSTSIHLALHMRKEE